MNVTRSARTGTSPTAISCAVMNGNASFDRSAPVTARRMSRLRGPQSAYVESCPVTSSTRATAPRRRACRRSHDMSCDPYAVPVTTMKASSATRVTVKSDSMPPRWFSACV